MTDKKKPLPLKQIGDGDPYRHLALGCIMGAIELAEMGSLVEMVWLETEGEAWFSACGYNLPFTQVLQRTRLLYRRALSNQAHQPRASQPALPGLALAVR